MLRGRNWTDIEACDEIYSTEEQAPVPKTFHQVAAHHCQRLVGMHFLRVDERAEAGGKDWQGLDSLVGLRKHRIAQSRLKKKKPKTQQTQKKKK